MSATYVEHVTSQIKELLRRVIEMLTLLLLAMLFGTALTDKTNKELFRQLVERWLLCSVM